MDPPRTFYSIDTFEGFDELNIVVEKMMYHMLWTAWSYAPTSVERVAHYVGDGLSPSNLRIVKGRFADSFKGLDEVRWRFVHIDFYLYQPIKAALETLWKPVLPGGVIMIHECGCYGFPTARKAVDEFYQAIDQLLIELPEGWCTLVLRKPLTATAT